MILDGCPKTLRPIVQVIDDWNTRRKLGLVFEARVGEGRLLVCSIDLSGDLAQRPAARQLRTSLLSYAGSDRFGPATRLEVAQVWALFRDLSVMEKLGGRIHAADSEQSGYPPSHALDGDIYTIWHTPWGDNAPGFPHELQVELASTTMLSGITALPRQDGLRNGWIREYEGYVTATARIGAAPRHGANSPLTNL